jgi:hypothetical protein
LNKTTLALHLIEQLLEGQIPVVLVDRKGDLAGDARERWWQQAANNPRARAIAETTDVHFFTPGIRGGRPLALSVIPDVNGLPDHEPSREVAHAANALVGMMGFGDGANDRARRAILLQAIEVLAERRAPAHLDDVIELLASRDDDLITRASRYQDRLFDRLVQDLETLRLNDGHLFDPKGEPRRGCPFAAQRRGKLGTLETGHFILLQDGAVSELVRTRSLIRTDQLPESEILSLATRSRTLH